MLFRSALSLRLAALSGVSLLAACAPTPSSAPRPPIVAPAPPAASPLPSVKVGDWRDVPLAAGTWRYVDGQASSAARYGRDGVAALLVVRCDKIKRQIAIMREGNGSQIDIITSSGTERFAAGRIDEGGVAMSGALFAAADPVLDRMLFSRGRFAVAAPGLEIVAVPAWAEPARTIEDCRK